MNLKFIFRQSQFVQFIYIYLLNAAERSKKKKFNKIKRKKIIENYNILIKAIYLKLSIYNNMSLSFIFSIARLVHSTKFQFDGNWGDWTQQWTAASGYYLCGAQMRYQSAQGGNRDDTAANGLIYYFCKFGDWNTKTGYRFDGLFGDWYAMVLCPYNSFVVGFQPRNEGGQGRGDDTALNGLRFICRDYQIGNQSTITIHTGDWGDWGDIYRLSDPNEFIFRYSFRYDWSTSGDPTAMNGIFFQAQRYVASSFDIDYVVPSDPRSFPQVLNFREIINCMSAPFTKTVTFEKTYQTTQTYQNSKGFSGGVKVWAGAQFQVFGIGGSVNLQVNTEFHSKFTFGQKKTQTQVYTDSLSVECPQRTKCFIQQMIKSARLNIPYLATFIYPRGERIVISGSFSGVIAGQSYDNITMVAVSPVNCPS